MRPIKFQAPDAPSKRPYRLLLWATLASLVFGAIGMGEILEDALRVGRNSLHRHPASGDIVFVGIDDKSVREVGRWPWPRSTQAKLIDVAVQQGAKRVFVDLVYDGPSSPSEDASFQASLERAKHKGAKVTIAAREGGDAAPDGREPVRPLPLFNRHAQLASIDTWYNYQNASWLLPYKAQVASRSLPSFAAAMSGKSSSGEPVFRVDYSVDINSIPYISATDFVPAEVPANTLAGKTVIIGVNNSDLGDVRWIPGHGKGAGALVHIVGAETLRAGRPIGLGWLPPLLLTLASVWLSLFGVQRRFRTMLLGATAAALLTVPIRLEAKLVFVDIVPALFLITFVGLRLSYLHLRRGNFVNSSTGLPNLAALRHDPTKHDLALVAARVQNYPAIASTLTNQGESELTRQIVSRFTAGGSTSIYQGDEGIFAWYVEPGAGIGNHLEALHALFRSPISAEKRNVDVALSFGVDMGSNGSVANRLGSALVAADEAWQEGLRWKYHDPARQEEVSWRLSLLGQLDAAIDNGEVWIAYQPQLDLKRNTVIGAEALARWTHPEKGPISPAEFVAAAEQNGRIGKLTDFVLDRAVATAAAINRRGVDFTIAVNVSARLLMDSRLVDRVQTTLRAHSLEPAKLTLELTETEALQGGDGSTAMLDALRNLGVRIAIDDYGTGLSTLDYLKKIPANEIKIDQTFVKSMRVNRSDLIMVQSTIALAHSLRRTVVAEGVEDHQCLDELSAMGCDVAQGFLVGRPMGARELVQRLQHKKTKRVA